MYSLLTAEEILSRLGLLVDTEDEDLMRLVERVYWAGHQDGWMAGNTDPDAYYE